MANKIPRAKPVHFFKIILTQNLHHGKLMMPRKFVEKYGECLPKTICVKTPNGVNWKLNLVKSDGKIWFQKGWKEFAEYHSLAHGHLLLFKYERTSLFHVHIFDKSALEINYPLTRVEDKRVFNCQGKKPSNNEDCRASQKRKTNSSFEIGSSSCVNVRKFQKAAVHHIDRKGKGKPVIVDADKVTTLERAKSFKTCNPSFVVVMGASYVEHHFLLTIPSMFGKRHFDLNKKRGDIHFQLSNGRVWPAKYRIRMSHTGLRFELSSGWKTFAKDNNLKVGDACNFELILSTNMTFQVHIFRETDKDNTNCSTSQSRINWCLIFFPIPFLI
ncbi:plant-specific B3-DNA-binding domain protein [Medicago truncatula]|uniref:Plant-specific B3-DNA-binding domain protein n=2 Tax=Medicago truncatula TaxID=3880 RepID=G7J3B6_MEDTR|nr:plant-specific B3-DNA-binding domain protein [Medicago truncatula]